MALERMDDKTLGFAIVVVGGATGRGGAVTSVLQEGCVSVVNVQSSSGSLILGGGFTNIHIHYETSKRSNT